MFYSHVFTGMSKRGKGPGQASAAKRMKDAASQHVSFPIRVDNSYRPIVHARPSDSTTSLPPSQDLFDQSGDPIPLSQRTSNGSNTDSQQLGIRPPVSGATPGIDDMATIRDSFRAISEGIAAISSYFGINPPTNPTANPTVANNALPPVTNVLNTQGTYMSNNALNNVNLQQQPWQPYSTGVTSSHPTSGSNCMLTGFAGPSLVSGQSSNNNLSIPAQHMGQQMPGSNGVSGTSVVFSNQSPTTLPNTMSHPFVQPMSTVVPPMSNYVPLHIPPPGYVPPPLSGYLTGNLPNTIAPAGNSIAGNGQIAGFSPNTVTQVQNTGVAPRQVMSIGLPIGYAVDHRIKNLIWHNKYVELSLLVDPEQDDDFDVQLNPKAGCFQFKRKKQPIRSLITWNEAMITYQAIMMQHPATAKDVPDFLCFLRDVKSMADENIDWGHYDVEYRKYRGNCDHPEPWSVFRFDLYNDARKRAYLARSNLNNQNYQRKSNNFSQSVSELMQNIPKGYCFAYHLPNQRCNRMRCSFKHLCHLCSRGEHPAFLCKNVRQPGQPQSQFNTQKQPGAYPTSGAYPAMAQPPRPNHFGQQSNSSGYSKPPNNPVNSFRTMPSNNSREGGAS